MPTPHMSNAQQIMLSEEQLQSLQAALSNFAEIRSHSHANNNQTNDSVPITIELANESNSANDAETIDSGSNPTAHLQDMLSNWWQGSLPVLPFALLLLGKLLGEHCFGLLMFLACYATYYHANSLMKACAVQRTLTRGLLLHLVWILIFLGANIFGLYYVFHQQRLYLALILWPTALQPMHVWNLLWIVLLTDSVLKYVTIIVKVMIALVPRFFLSFSRRGVWYMSIELVSQLYRQLVPITPWLQFLVNSPDSESLGTGALVYVALLVIAYVIVKAFFVWKALMGVRGAYQTLRKTFGASSSSFMTSFSHLTAFTEAGLSSSESCVDVCPICQDAFADPMQLSCGHIFCQECVALWFDRQRSCPVCRAKVASQDPAWRDSSTSAGIQLL